jgi:hypothetical protein
MPRGRGTFVSIDDYPYDERRRTRSRQDAVAEVAVDYAIPDIEDFVLRVERRDDKATSRLLWERRA